ncbi:hypothetical protein NON00_02760 [Roseomonas sp. GC11]|uniref:sugar-transfer associated ATP-grasp domain-containing protein n=1 Tax=Roseomonas sp. GC11 TaxID=2950546 RepID=UPI00210EBA21|nr:sugar-transfer associated ATP-grasp domain-containing protein [Roseomonas sp. GC11]MCQ4158848.1 hypothetical protein [Roseomonas sp. GC11]
MNLARLNAVLRHDSRQEDIPAEALLAGVLRAMARKNAGLQPDLAPELRARLWARGFLADKWRLLDMPRHGMAGFVSDLQRRLARAINGPQAALLDDKLALARLLEGHARQPEILAALYDRGAARSLSPGWAAALHGATPVEVYAKPAQGAMGWGLRRAWMGGGAVLWNGRRFSGEAFLARLAASGVDYLVTLGLAQHPALAALHPGTTNTLRLLVLRAPGSGTPFLAAAALRVGTTTSGDIDNFARGGLSFPLDRAEGVILPGVRRRADGWTEPVAAHPESGQPIAGGRVPLWPEVVALALAPFARLPFLRHVGWDIALTPEGPAIIEGNSHSGLDVFQVHGPLLADPAIRAFYEAYGLLDVTGPDATPDDLARDMAPA